MNRYGVAAFASTHSAMRAEKHLKGRVAATMMPTPRAVTAACGISLRFALEDWGAVCAALEELEDAHGTWSLYEIQN